MHGAKCTKCDRPRKVQALPYGANCRLAPLAESRDDFRDILSGREDMLEVPHLHSHSVLVNPEDPAAEPAVPETVEQGPGILSPTAPAMMASPAITTTIITAGSISNRVLMECALAALSTRLGQQGKERAKDRC